MSASNLCSKNVSLLGHSNVNGFGNGGQVTVQKQGGEYYAYIGHMKGMGTSIINVTNQAKPKVVAQIPIPENTHSHKVRVCGDLMLVNNERLGQVGSFEAGLRIFDISNPSNPKEISFFQTGGTGVHRFWLDCDTKLAYLSTEMEGYLGAIFMVVDVSNPRKPREVSRWWLPGQWIEGGEKPSWDPKKKGCRHHHPIILGDRAYLGYWDGGFVILDISNIRSPKIVSRADYTPPYGGAFHTALPVDREIVNRRWLVVFQESLAPPHEEGKKLMWMVDRTVETNPVSVATFQVPVVGAHVMEDRFGPHQPYEDVHVRGDLIYAAWFGAGLRIINIADPYRPMEVGYFIPEAENQRMIQTNDVFVDDRGFIYIIDRLERGLDILRYAS